MSDRRDEDPGARIVRAAALAGRPGDLLTRGRPQADLYAPGRGFLEISILLSALAILIPVCAAGAVPAALLARRAGNRRWLAALLAALWCALLGAALRSVLALAVVP
ncbi:MAG: hypothetical protein ACYDH6_22195 [Acidimicrobiales bacterium]